MQALRIEDIKENPFSVLSRPLPENPSRFLLILAQIAATCCRQIAEETIVEIEATHGIDDTVRGELRDALEQWHRAHQKIGEVCFILRDDFGVPVFDFYLARDERPNQSLRTKLKAMLVRLLAV
jgi:hypothetical protein